MSRLPGASYHSGNLSAASSRPNTILDTPVRVEFEQKWEQGNPLFDWFDRFLDPMIEIMQLRRERNPPFFHQYIAFGLSGSGKNKYFRIDRRQLPDESSPLDSLYSKGVKPYDTVEPIQSLDHSNQFASDCLIEIKFDSYIQLAHILNCCYAIHMHPTARVYTLQRYNCYFFAQTILVCAARSVSIRGRGKLKLNLKPYDSASERAATEQCSKPASPLDPSEGLTANATMPISGPSGHTNRVRAMSPKPSSTPQNDLPRSCGQPGSPSMGTSPTPGLTFQSVCEVLISAVPVNGQQLNLRHNLDGVLNLLADFWDRALRRSFTLLEDVDFQSLLEESLWSTGEWHCLDQAYGEMMHVLDDYIRKTWATSISQALSTFSANLITCLLPCGDVQEITPGSSPVMEQLRRSRSALETWLTELEQCNFNTAYHTLKRTVQDEYTQAHICTFNRHRDSFNGMSLSTMFAQRISRQSGRIHPVQRQLSTYEAMQDCVISLIKQHSLRVQKHKAILQCSASEVKRDILKVMADVWREVVILTGTRKRYNGFRPVPGGFPSVYDALTLAIEKLGKVVATYKEDTKDRLRYTNTKSELDKLSDILNTRFSGNHPPSMTPQMTVLCAEIKRRLDIILKKKRPTVKQNSKAGTDLDSMGRHYQRIQYLLETLKFCTDWNTKSSTSSTTKPARDTGTTNTSADTEFTSRATHSQTSYKTAKDIATSRVEERFPATTVIYDLVQHLGTDVSGFRRNPQTSYRLVELARDLHDEIINKIKYIEASSNWEAYDAYTQAIDPLEELLSDIVPVADEEQNEYLTPASSI